MGVGEQSRENKMMKKEETEKRWQQSLSHGQALIRRCRMVVVRHVRVVRRIGVGFGERVEMVEMAETGGEEASE